MKLSVLLGIIMALGLLFSSQAQAQSTNASAHAAARFETQTQKYRTHYVSAILENDGRVYKLTVLIAKQNGEPPVKYEDVLLKVTDASGQKLSIKRTFPDVSVFVEASSFGSTADGFYIVEKAGNAVPKNIRISYRGIAKDFSFQPLK